VEEPENHLHKTTLLKLSQLLFNENEYQYLFITTHSDVLLTEMDNVNLIRIFKSKSNDLNLLETKSVLYEVKDEFRKYKRQLNIFLSQALFYNRVMLVEGPSEFTLFDAILTHKINYATKGLFILPVNGIGFEKYLEVLLPLNIKVFVKTDNDIISGRPAGINRILKLGKLVAYINKEECLLKELEKVNIDGNEFENTNEARKQVYNEARKQVYKDNIEIIKSIQNLANIYLSNIDLENDISAALSNLYEILEKENNEKAVKFLQKLKLYNMIELISKMKDEDFEEIFKSEYFKILEDFINGIN
jgi:putative ATP-dependent endonuclease of OLD family